MKTKAQKSLKLSRQKIIKEARKSINSKLYNGWDIGKVEPYTVTHKSMNYTVKPQYIVSDDSVDVCLGGSTELSHKSSLGYSVIDHYEGKKDELDFTFAEPQDIIKIQLADNIKKVVTNFSNLENAEFRGKEAISYDVILDCSMLETFKVLKTFFDKNPEMIKYINFYGINNTILKQLLEKACTIYEYNATFHKEMRTDEVEKNDTEER